MCRERVEIYELSFEWINQGWTVFYPDGFHVVSGGHGYLLRPGPGGSIRLTTKPAKRNPNVLEEEVHL